MQVTLLQVEIGAQPMIFFGGGCKQFKEQRLELLSMLSTSSDGAIQLAYEVFDFLPRVFAGLTKEAVSWRISDHYPLWVEFLL